MGGLLPPLPSPPSPTPQEREGERVGVRERAWYKGERVHNVCIQFSTTAETMYSPSYGSETEKRSLGEDGEMKGALSWDSELQETVYYLRWSVNSDAMLRRWNKLKKKNSRINIPAVVWRSLVADKELYFHKITSAEDPGEEVEEKLLTLPLDWMLRLDTYKDQNYVGLLRADPTDPNLILGGVGMNFYPEDYAALLSRLTQRAEAETLNGPHHKRRKKGKEEQNRTRVSFSKTLYQVSLRRTSDEALISAESFCSRTAIRDLLETVDGAKEVPTTTSKTRPFSSFEMKSSSHNYQLGHRLLNALYCKCIEGTCDGIRLIEQGFNAVSSTQSEEEEEGLYTDEEVLAASAKITVRTLLHYLFKIIKPGSDEADDLKTPKQTIGMLHQVMNFIGDPSLRRKDQDPLYMKMVDTFVPNKLSFPILKDTFQTWD